MLFMFIPCLWVCASLDLMKCWVYCSSSISCSLFVLSIAYFQQSMLSAVAVSSSMMKSSVGCLLISLTLWILILCFYCSAKPSSNINRFTGAFWLSGLFLILFFSVSKMSLFYFLFEVTAIPMVVLIIGWGYQPERMQASIYMLVYTVSASLPLLAFIVYSFWGFGSLSFFLHCPPHIISDSPWVFLVLVAFLVKLPVFGFHLWLPKAHSEAPVAGSMLLAGLLLKLGGFGLIRSIGWWGFSLRGPATEIIAVVSLCGGVITSLICLSQTDIKALVAYSSIGHMSLVIGGLFSATQTGWLSAGWIMLAHGLCSSGLFALVNNSYLQWGSRSVFLVKGGLSVLPSVSLWWFLLASANMACPPTLNLISEIALFCASVFLHCWFVFPAAMMVFLAAAYSLYLYTSTQHGVPATPHRSFIRPNDMMTASAMHWVPLNILALGCSSLG
uniref:NADH-ubiquinone oxidoreductase chain 4 n=1 Tax=Laternula elliptica TaxID=228457 RepID=U5TX30_LATEL|nr:NADH dehydrogenase subunit 4 [Laternula elliptica]AGZ13056.1 NADH dehydrogenase subunit 4 [Laternula elliptica]